MASTGEVLLKSGQLIDEKLVKLLEKMGVDQVMVRSPITCETRYGVCAQCYGRDLGRGHRINIGEAVGVIAAQSIGEPGTQLTMRTFHVGGAASRAAAANGVEVKSKGTIRLHNIKTVRHEKGHLVAVSRSGELGVVDEFGRERERYKIPYGATITVNDADVVAAGQSVANWDPHTHPVVTEVAGMIKFSDFVDGITVTTQVDDVTGLSSTVVLDPKQRGSGGKDLRPVVRLTNAKGKEVTFANTDIPAVYALPAGAIVSLERRLEGVGGRRHCAYPAGVFEDSRHHRRSAACGRLVRSAQAEGLRDSGGAQRHGQLRQGDQGQASLDHHQRVYRQV